MRIESGPTTERKIRNTLLTIMLAVFSAWFAYDGWAGYPAKNHEEFLNQLPKAEREKAKSGPVYPRLIHKEVNGKDHWLEATREAIAKGGASSGRKEIESLFGGPPSYEAADAWYYYGHAVQIKIAVTHGEPGSVQAQRSQKKDSDIFTQKLLAGSLGALLLYSIWFVVNVSRTHLVLDEAGLAYRSVGPIRWEDMQALDISRFARKGWAELVYNDQGTQRRLRLDEYHLAKFDDVIDQICARKGFENPLPVRDSVAQESASST